MQVGGVPEPSSAYVHCRLPDIANEERGENSIGISGGSDAGSRSRSTATGKRYVATIHFTISGIQPSGEKPETVERIIYPNSIEGEKPCVDDHEECEFWAKEGECEKNPNYMLTSCAKSCSVCV